MSKVLFPLLFLALLSTEGLAYQPAKGWHWYNEQVERKIKKRDGKEEQALMSAFNQLSATKQLKILQMATNNLKAKAVLSGRVHDITLYKQAQDFWTDKATQFTVGWEKMLLAHPELNYSLSYSHENALAATSQRGKHTRESKAVRALSQENGLLFFYRGKNKGDLLFSKVIKRYTKENKFTLISIPVDAVIAPASSKAHQSRGIEKADALGIHYFPALVLVNPKTKQHEVVSYGFKSENELSDRLLKIADGWRAEF